MLLQKALENILYIYIKVKLAAIKNETHQEPEQEVGIQKLVDGLSDNSPKVDGIRDVFANLIVPVQNDDDDDDSIELATVSGWSIERTANSPRKRVAKTW